MNHVETNKFRQQIVLNTEGKSAMGIQQKYHPSH
jgi:hypothetical protein